MHEVTIHNVSPELYESVRGALLGHHEGKELTSGVEMDVNGIRATYNYDAKGKALKVAVVGTPAVITRGYALGQLYDMLGRLAVKTPGQV